MKKILTIGELRQAIQHLDDIDEVLIELAPQGVFHIISIDDSILVVNDDFSTMREVRICI